MSERKDYKKEPFPLKGDIVRPLRDKSFIKMGESYVVDRVYQTTGRADNRYNYIIFIRKSTIGGCEHLYGHEWEFASGCYQCRYDCKRREVCEFYEEGKKW